MPVQDQNSEYLGALPKWRRIRDALAGEDAIKQAGDAYLPKLSGQSDDDYKNFVMRAQFFNATGRTVESFVGMIFRKEPTVTIPSGLDEFKNDITLHGQTFDDYAKFITKEVVSIGRTGSLIDWSEIEQRPYVTSYQAENIINWRRERIGGKIALSMVVLHEKIDAAQAQKFAESGEPGDQSAANEPTKPAFPSGVIDHTSYTGPAKETDTTADEYCPKLMEQIRVLRLVPSLNKNPDASMIYAVEIWQKPDPKKDEFNLVNTIYPTRKGGYLTAIPFVFHNPNNTLPNIDKPPMEDIVSVNISHYRSSADLEHGLHFIGLPTPFISGVDSKEVIKLGADKAIIATDPQARASFLEFKGEGLKSIESALDRKERQMAVLGARMLEQAKRAVETVEVMQMKQTGEQASLAQIALTTSEGLEAIFQWALWWIGAADMPIEQTKEQIDIDLNKDFNPTTIDPQLVLAIVSAVQAGILSLDSAIYCMKQGELVNPNRTAAEEIDMIASEVGKNLKLPTAARPGQGQPAPGQPAPE